MNCPAGLQRGYVRTRLSGGNRLAAAVVAVGLVWMGGSTDAAPPAAPQPLPTVPDGVAQPAVGGRQAQPPAANKLMAMVNSTEISQKQLADECLSRHGAGVLETLVNKKIIEQACLRQGVAMTAQDIDTEIDAMSRRFNVPRDKWIDLIKRERGITARQYSEEIVWPMVALRRLAHASIEPDEEDILAAYDNQFGPAVKARILVVRAQEEAVRLRAQALLAPDEFGGLARQHSVDIGSASANGWVQPIRRHTGEPRFEAVAFGLAPGDISEVVQVADQFIVIKCEGHLPAADVKLADVRGALLEEIRERKSRAASSELFRGLQNASTVENIMNDPDKSVTRPGVAALVNGEAVDLERVRETCLDRHGADVLEILITRVLLKQALDRAQQQVTQADLDSEVVRAALAMGFRKPDGSADTSAWLERVTREQKVPLRHYVEDIVQPTVALKKLVGKVPVTNEDLDKAFDATFGPRARCRVIVLDNQRRAQEVWQMARENPTAERMGDLAEKYSVDPTSRTLRGEVPPIQRFGGQPALEREAFALKPGELSGIVQIADRFLVLFCEGYTEPMAVKFAEVRDELHED
ncbi:MAG: peptidylprolyl isomerase, partial [Planctomycetota bacterium]